MSNRKYLLGAGGVLKFGTALWLGGRYHGCCAFCRTMQAYVLNGFLGLRVELKCLILSEFSENCLKQSRRVMAEGILQERATLEIVPFSF